MVDSLSIANRHQVIQVLMGCEDDHLHRFRMHGRDYGIIYIGGPLFVRRRAAVPPSCFAFRTSERFLYEYDFAAGWQIEVRVERVIRVGPALVIGSRSALEAAGPALPTIAEGLRPMRRSAATRLAGQWCATWTLSWPSCDASATVRYSIIPSSVSTPSAR